MKVIDEKQDLDPDLDPYLLVRGMDPRIRIRTKMSRISDTAAVEDTENYGT
jgi:hypothetical protein